MTDVGAALKRLSAWFRQEALPLWLDQGYDGERGGFYEALDFAGRPVQESLRRTRVQARQIYVFSSAARVGWHSRAEGLARSGFEYFLSKACPNDGERGCVYLLGPDGRTVDDRRDLYDQAFLLLASAAFWQAFRDSRAIDLAVNTLDFVDRDLAAPGGGYWEDDQESKPRRQNPHMHLFEAFLALHRATGESLWAQRADQMYILFNQSFFDRKKGVLREYLSDDLQQADQDQGDIIEPGHMAEWVWLLDKYRALGNNVGDLQTILYESAVKYGRANRHGFLPDFLRLNEDSAESPYRLWPQTELIKASLIRDKNGDAEAAAHAAGVARGLFETYLDQPVKGLWCDQYDSVDNPMAKAVPASILYHLFESVLEIDAYVAGDQK